MYSLYGIYPAYTIINVLFVQYDQNVGNTSCQLFIDIIIYCTYTHVAAVVGKLPGGVLHAAVAGGDGQGAGDQEA